MQNSSWLRPQKYSAIFLEERYSDFYALLIRVESEDTRWQCAYLFFFSDLHMPSYRVQTYVQGAPAMLLYTVLYL